MKKLVAVIGLNRFGLNLVESLSKLNVDIIAIDQDLKKVQKASELTDNVFALDSTNDEALKDAGIQNVDHAVVCFGKSDKANLSSSIITIIKLKELGIKEITARADDDESVEALKLIGATDVITPLLIASEKIANKIASKNVIDYYNIKNEYDIFEINIPKDYKKVNITQIDSRNKYKLNILLIERNMELITPNKDSFIEPNDNIFIFGKKKDINKLINLFTK